eukprot:TRINITY_DN10688_c0_g1_i1.p1 TRINITY_DN10688_c0_g1~~TRINITY_DN10688_c0_g1_i1.p1  ORF type:complete len:214 (+),score=44.29 TRINITY_DN10688_c0_g1_i1:47-688(+)
MTVSMGSEEEIMKMRLLFDGDGQGDERRMNLLLKNVLKFATSKDSDEKAIETQYQRMLGQLSSIEYYMVKTREMQVMNEQEASNYSDLESKIIEGIEEARGIIESTKLELEDAKIIRKNKLEYDEIGKKINELASREASLARIQEIESEKAQLALKEKEIEQKLDKRREQFSVIIKSIHQLQELIFEEDGVSYMSDDNEDNDQEIVTLDISQD